MFETWTDLNGVWRGRIDKESFMVFPENKDGDRVPIRIRRNTLYMKHNDTGSCTVFRYSCHRGQWRWKSDTGDDDCVLVMKMLTRMVGGDTARLLVDEMERTH